MQNYMKSNEIIFIDESNVEKKKRIDQIPHEKWLKMKIS